MDVTGPGMPAGVASAAGAAAGRASTSLSSIAIRHVPLALGQLLQARVLDVLDDRRVLTQVQGAPLILRSALTVSPGQLLELQVMQLEPRLEVRVTGNNQANKRVPDAPSQQTARSGSPISAIAGDAARLSRTALDRMAQGETVITTTVTEPLSDPGSARAPLSAQAAEQVATELAEVITALFSGPLANRPASALRSTARTRGAAGGAESSGTTAASATDANATTPSSMPEEIRAATDTARADAADAPAASLLAHLWQGSVFPGIPASIQLEDQAAATGDDALMNAWSATLTMSLPHLGTVAASLNWSIRGLRIRLQFRLQADGTARAELDRHVSDLTDLLRTLQIRVEQVVIDHV